MMKNLCCLVIISLFLVATGCEKDSKILSKKYPYLILSEITEITETGVTVNAEVISTGEYTVGDFGFVISTGSKPVITDRKISLKSVLKSPDKMSFRIDNDLYTNERYYVRAYIQTASQLVYSNVQTFDSKGSMNPRIDRLSMTSGIPGNLVTITGNYFGEIPGHNIVRFGNLNANILRQCRDTLVVQCPNTPATKTVSVSVEVAGHTGDASSLFDLVNPWTPLAGFPGGARFWSSSFTIGTSGYVTLGLVGVDIYATNELWEFNSLTNQWQSVAAFPGTVRGKATSFAIGNSGYVGLGLGMGVTRFSDLWAYSPQTGSWAKKADFPGSTFWEGNYPHFVIDNKLYLYTGFNTYELWTYDPALDIWTRLPTDDRMKNHNITEGFSVGNTGYFIENSTGKGSTVTFQIWQYDPSLNKIMPVDSVATASYFIELGSFNIGRKLFLSARDHLLIEYDMDSKLLFYHNHPSEKDMFNFSMVFSAKAIVNNIETPDVIEFNSAAALHAK